MTKHWQPGRTAPKDGRWVLLVCDLCGDRKSVIAARWDEKKAESLAPERFGRFGWVPSGGDLVAEGVVTHWMDIPKLPRLAEIDAAVKDWENRE
jgi:hypothetical protein